MWNVRAPGALIESVKDTNEPKLNSLHEWFERDEIKKGGEGGKVR